MNSSLQAALELVVRDLASTGGITLRVLETDGDPLYESVWLLSGRRDRTGLLAPREMAGDERVVHVADQVQEFVLEEHRRADRAARVNQSAALAAAFFACLYSRTFSKESASTTSATER